MRSQFVLAIAIALPCCGAEKVDDGLRKAVNEVLYRVETPTSGVYRADNVAQRLGIEFDARETRLNHPQGSASFRLLGYGYGRHLRAPEKAEPQASGNRVEYRRGELTEWYQNESGGLEQGFTLARRPGSAQKGEPLVIALHVDGVLQPAMAPEGDAVLLGQGRNNVLRYEGLRSWDAHGKAIGSRMEVRGRDVRLLIEDRNAQYPLVVDPVLVQAAELQAGDGAANDHFGWSVSTFGYTVVGAPGKNSNQGAVYVFVQNNNGTYQLVKELTASDGIPGDQFGWAVWRSNQNSSNSEFIYVGAPGKQVNGNAHQGAVYVFTTSVGCTSCWTQTNTLNASDGAAGDQFGSSVIWESNGYSSSDSLIVGAPGKNSNQGAVYVFAGISPYGQLAELTATDGVAGDRFGVSLGAGGELDGQLIVNTNVLFIGAPNKQIGMNPNQGAVYLFYQNSGSSWQQTEVTASDGAAGDNFGFSVWSVPGDSELIIGAPNKKIGSNAKQGAVYTYPNQISANSPTTLMQRQELTALDGDAGDEFGYSVAQYSVDSSANGYFLVVGAPFKNASQGAMYLFTAPYTGTNSITFTQMQELVPADGVAGDQFGYSVSLFRATVIAGAPGKQVNSNAGQGVAYPFGAPIMLYVSPNSGSGLSQTFTTLVTHADMQNNGVIYLDFGTTGLGQPHSCFVGFQSSGFSFFLYNDTNTAVSFVQPGTNQMASNSQCTLTGVAVTDPNQVPFAITFAPGYTGTKNIYGSASASNQTTGQVLLGTWTPAPLGPPTAVSVAPNSGSGLGPQTFTAVYTDPAGASDLQVTYLEIAVGGGAQHSCFVAYVQSNNSLYLFNDANSGVSAAITPGSSGTASNGQCTLSGNGGTVTASGNNLTVPFSITFTSTFTGPKNVLGYAQSYSGANSGWQTLGSWTPAPAGTITAVSVAPINSSGFGPQTFMASYTDSSGGSDVQVAYLDFGPALFAANSCIVAYVQSSNMLYLFNDANSGAAPVAAGSSSTVSNSQCTLSGLGGTGTASGTSFSAPFSIQFAAGFNSAQMVFGMAQSYGGTQSSWANFGTWTP